jgi:DNA repair exonuclease SbcCD ATPase subunit
MDLKEDQSASNELAVAKAKIKMLQKQVNELTEIQAQVDGLQKNIQGLLSVQLEMERRNALREEREIFRHEMTFNGIKRIATDVQHIKQRVEALHVDGDGDIGCGPGSARKTPVKSDAALEVRSPGTVAMAKRASENRKNFERALQHHVSEMHEAKTMDELQTAGALAVQYSDQLFKTFL